MVMVYINAYLSQAKDFLFVGKCKDISKSNLIMVIDM